MVQILKTDKKQDGENDKACSYSSAKEAIKELTEKLLK
jgi:hypothetical protein